MRYGFTPVLFGFVAALAAMPALAQSGGGRLRGTIDSVGADGLNMTTRSGTKAHVTLPPGVRVTFVVAARMADIQPGSYIGTAATREPDGTLRALEVHVFPPSMRGRGEGFRPFDVEGGGEATMTNGTVGNLVTTTGRVATVTYGNGEKRVLIPDDVPIVSFEDADRSALTPGAKIIASGSRGEDGSLVAATINVGKDGLTPPM